MPFNPLAPLADHLAEARNICRATPIIDAHTDVLWRARTSADHDFLTGAGCYHISHGMARKGGIRVLGLSLFTEVHEHGPASFDATERMIATAESYVERAPDRFSLIRTQSELADLLDRGEDDPLIGGILWIEGGSPIQGKLETAETLIARGVRGLILTHNHDNEIGSACAGASLKAGEEAGLTTFGRELIPLLEAHGVLIDLAHAGPKLVADTLAIATKPVVVSHGGNRERQPSPRNLDDEQIRALADTGGLYAVDFYPGHIGEPGPDGHRRASLDDLVDAIERVIRITNDDHVALGSDFDGYGNDLTGLETAEQLPNLVAALLARGHDQPRIHKILTRNWQRVLQTTLPS